MQRLIHYHTFPVFHPFIKPHPAKLLKELRRGTVGVSVKNWPCSSLLKFEKSVKEFITTVSPSGTTVI